MCTHCCTPQGQANIAVLDEGALAGQRSKEAEELLSRSFEVRQHNPAMFALLCDELTDAVVAGRLSEPLREWLKLSATDQLEGFLDDFKDTPADVQVCLHTMSLLALMCALTCHALAGLARCLDIGRSCWYGAHASVSTCLDMMPLQIASFLDMLPLHVCASCALRQTWYCHFLLLSELVTCMSRLAQLKLPGPRSTDQAIAIPAYAHYPLSCVQPLHSHHINIPGLCCCHIRHKESLKQ